MSNPFLSYGTKDVATAKLYEKAVIADLEKIFGTNAPALTDGNKIYVNTEDNLFQIFPDYSTDMLKILLWHEELHLMLSHHNRFFRYLEELNEAETLNQFQVTKEEVNIIMDILVHDSLFSKNMYPDLIEVAKKNYAQLRNCNSLGYTFKTRTLEDMLNEYKDYKYQEPQEQPQQGPGTPGGDDPDNPDNPIEQPQGSTGSNPTDDPDNPTGTGGSPSNNKQMTDDEKKKATDDKSKGRKAHAGGGNGQPPKTKREKNEEEKEEPTGPVNLKQEDLPEHDQVDWSKIQDIDSKEFITEEEGKNIQRSIEKLKRQKLKLARVAQTLNGLATDQRIRTYAVPSKLQIGRGVILKGRKPGKAKLYLIFDSSGSMSDDMNMFKDLIKEAIPQALKCPCEWHSGWPTRSYISKLSYKREYHGHRSNYYFKGKFEDFMYVEASGGTGEDGDRVIELCVEAEEKGYNPVAVTDGGGDCYYPETLKKLKRTVIVGNEKWYLNKIKKINPAIQTIYTGEY